MPANYVLFRQLAGGLFALEALLLAPGFLRYFGRAYDPRSFIVARPVAMALLALWFAACAGLMLGMFPLVAAAVMTLIFRYFHVEVRYRSLARGAGAVGFMPYLIAAYLMLFELARESEGGAVLAETVFWVLRIDMALILFDAGLTKLLSGYRRNEGFEYALANPFWGRFFASVRKMRPTATLFRLQNVAACGTELLVAALLLVPQTLWLAGAIMMAMFAYLAIVLRLLTLCPLMVALGLLFLPELGWQLLPTDESAARWQVPALLLTAVQAALWAYVGVTIVIKLVQYANYFADRRLPAVLQRVIDVLGRLIPVFIWRVFTPDVINFFVRITRIGADGTPTTVLDEDTVRLFSGAALRPRLRFLSAAESVTIVSMFMKLKYQQGDRADFHERLLRYAKTLWPRWCDADSRLRFEYVAVRKGETTFDYLPALRLDVDLQTQTVTETSLVDDFYAVALIPDSPIRPGLQTGTYTAQQSR